MALIDGINGQHKWTALMDGNNLRHYLTALIDGINGPLMPTYVGLCYVDTSEDSIGT
jgi:hypothetical protein